MQNVANIAAAAIASTTSVARPLNRQAPTRNPGMPASRVIPDYVEGRGVLINIADGTIGGETPGHIALTVDGSRMESTMPYRDWITKTRGEVTLACASVLNNPASTEAQKQEAEQEAHSFPTDERLDQIPNPKALVTALVLKWGVRKSDLRTVTSRNASASLLSAMA